MKKFMRISVAAVVASAVLAAAASAWAVSCGGGGQACGSHEKSSTPAHSKGRNSSSFLKSYFEMRSILASDKVGRLGRLAKNLAGQTSKFRKTLKDEASPEQLAALEDIEKAASVMKASDINAAREGFKGLSRAVLAYVKSYGCDGSAYSFYCDMVKQSWLQETDKIGNPYYGSRMLTCGVMTGHMMNGRYLAN
jgi:Cu(I)/Ag(I) efflux system membrane fusion protein